MVVGVGRGVLGKQRSRWLEIEAVEPNTDKGHRTETVVNSTLIQTFTFVGVLAPAANLSF